jgi:Flp pilus assembly protein TadG
VRKFLRRWLKKDEGTTAIEFSLMAIPYIFLTLGIVELSIMYASASLLEGATNAAARQIRTGQIQQSEAADPEEVFRESICNYATVLIDCSQVVIEVQEMESFSDFEELQPQFDEDGNMLSRGFSAGGSSSRVLIRVAYTYNMLSPFIGTLLAGADNSIFFMSTIVLQTEPYDFEEIT